MVANEELADVWNAVERLLVASFPQEELGSLSDLFASLFKPDRTLWVNSTTDVRVVAVMCDLNTPSRDALLEFLAVDPHQRSSGIGSCFLRSLMDQSPMSIVLEVEDPDVFRTPEATRRVAFYERLGGILLPCGTGYAMPNLATGRGRLPMRLIEMNQDRAVELRGAELRRLVVAIWTRAYSRLEGDIELTSMLADLAC